MVPLYQQVSNEVLLYFQIKMRSFVKIKEQTDASLHLVKETGLYGYALLTGNIEYIHDISR